MTARRSHTTFATDFAADGGFKRLPDGDEALLTHWRARCSWSERRAAAELAAKDKLSEADWIRKILRNAIDKGLRARF